MSTWDLSSSRVLCSDQSEICSHVIDVSLVAAGISGMLAPWFNGLVSFDSLLDWAVSTESMWFPLDSFLSSSDVIIIIFCVKIDFPGLVSNLELICYRIL